MSYQRITLQGAGQMSAQEQEAFHNWMQARNNTFTNTQGQQVVIERGVVTESLHDSTTISDPYDTPHWTITLTNATLFANDGSTHLLHFRPANPETSYFYNRSYTRTEVTAIQNSKRKSKAKKKAKGDKNDKNDKNDKKDQGGRGGGGGAAVVVKSSGRLGNSQTTSSTGRSQTSTSTGRSQTSTSTGRSQAPSSTGRSQAPSSGRGRS